VGATAQMRESSHVGQCGIWGQAGDDELAGGEHVELASEPATQMCDNGVWVLVCEVSGAKQAMRDDWLDHSGSRSWEAWEQQRSWAGTYAIWRETGVEYVFQRGLETYLLPSVGGGIADHR